MLQGDDVLEADAHDIPHVQRYFREINAHLGFDVKKGTRPSSGRFLGVGAISAFGGVGVRGAIETQACPHPRCQLILRTSCSRLSLPIVWSRQREACGQVAHSVTHRHSVPTLPTEVFDFWLGTGRLVFRTIPLRVACRQTLEHGCWTPRVLLRGLSDRTLHGGRERHAWRPPIRQDLRNRDTPSVWGHRRSSPHLDLKWIMNLYSL